MVLNQIRVEVSCVEDEFNVPIALSAFRDKGSRLWSLKKFLSDQEPPLLTFQNVRRSSVCL